MLEESEKMIVDAATRLGQAVQKLHALIVRSAIMIFHEPDLTMI
jgi:hypothetical protein